MSDCVHGLDAAWCFLCRHAGEGSVWVSDGGSAFHLRSDCPALNDGQRRVERWGGPSTVTAVVTDVKIGQAQRVQAPGEVVVRLGRIVVEGVVDPPVLEPPIGAPSRERRIRDSRR